MEQRKQGKIENDKVKQRKKERNEILLLNKLYNAPNIAIGSLSFLSLLMSIGRSVNFLKGR